MREVRLVQRLLSGGGVFQLPEGPLEVMWMGPGATHLFIGRLSVPPSEGGWMAPIDDPSLKGPFASIMDAQRAVQKFADMSHEYREETL